MRMKSLFVLLTTLLLFCGNAFAFEIYALGTSSTNCKGVDRNKIYTVKLQEILRRDGYDATVVNGGIDGDRPSRMLQRLPAAINSNTRLIIFEPGSLEPDRSYALQHVEEILSFLQVRNMPAIYASSPAIESREEAAETAKKYGAYYYGAFGKGIPADREHRQFDNEKEFGGRGVGPAGHMTAAGCAMVAEQMAPLVEKVLIEKAGLAPKR